MRLVLVALLMLTLAPVAASLGLPTAEHRAVGVFGVGGGVTVRGGTAPSCSYLASLVESDGLTITATLVGQDTTLGPGCSATDSFSLTLPEDVWGQLLASGGGVWEAQTGAPCNGFDDTRIDVALDPLTGTYSLSVFHQRLDSCTDEYVLFSASGAIVS